MQAPVALRQPLSCQSSSPLRRLRNGIARGTCRSAPLPDTGKSGGPGLGAADLASWQHARNRASRAMSWHPAAPQLEAIDKRK